MYKNSTIHVVVPAFNEEALVGSVIRTMPAFVDRIFVVDDCSTDATARVVEAVGEPRMTLLRTPRNLGVGGATIVRSGSWMPTRSRASSMSSATWSNAFSAASR